MQFKVPQNIQREDRIVGPLTLKQLIICGIGGIIGYGIYVALAKYYQWLTWLPPVAIVTIITIAFAFVRPLDLSFAKWIIRWTEFSLNPRKRVWVKASAEIIERPQTEKQNAKAKQKEQDEMDQISAKQKKLEELNKFLDQQKSKKS